MLYGKQEHSTGHSFFVKALFSLLFMLISRMIAMWLIPLNDVTEARYGEIARKMLETGNWVTPLHDYGVPFWAKPPLSTWLSALSMQFFGVNEFAVRLPALLLSIGILWLIWGVAKKQSGSVVAWASTVILASALYFYLDAGTVMTDPALIFCTTLALISFWRAMTHGQKTWSYVFFISLGLGLLAKGPVAIVLVGLPLFFWVLFTNQWVNLWVKLPWITGSCLTLLIALPWYLLAEQRTPGFLQYFIVGEHLQRFLTPGWTGDKYGMAHDEHWGMVWVYAIAGIFPWCLLISSWFIRNWKNIPTLCRNDYDGWLFYLFLCMMVPLFFFTFSSNIIYTYVFPSLPAFALFFAEIWNRSTESLMQSRLIIPMSLVCGVVVLIVTLGFITKPETLAKTQKFMVTNWQQQKPRVGTSLAYWNDKTEFSAQFYASGKVKATRDANVLKDWVSHQLVDYVVVDSRDLTQIPAEMMSHFKAISSVHYKELELILYRISSGE